MLMLVGAYRRVLSLRFEGRLIFCGLVVRAILFLFALLSQSFDIFDQAFFVFVEERHLRFSSLQLACQLFVLALEVALIGLDGDYLIFEKFVLFGQLLVLAFSSLRPRCSLF